jgi:hypothetical protein
MALSNQELDALFLELRGVRAEIALCKRKRSQVESPSAVEAWESRLEHLEAQRTRLLEDLRGAWG